MTKRYFFTPMYFVVFKKLMLQETTTDPFNPLVPKAHNREGQNQIILLRIKPVEVNLKLIGAFILFAPSALMG